MRSGFKAKRRCPINTPDPRPFDWVPQDSLPKKKAQGSMERLERLPAPYGNRLPCAAKYISYIVV
jgi:hypothetical protein